MKGSIHFRKDRGYFQVAVYHGGRLHRFSKYKGQTIFDRRLAEKLLSVIQADIENNLFRPDKYTTQPTDVVPYLRMWLTTIAPTLKPATVRDYRNSVENHLIPFFKERNLQLHEISLDTLVQLLHSIDRSGKGKRNVLTVLHTCMDFAWRSGRIPAIPPFPRRKQYGIVEKPIEWLPEYRQLAVIEAIPVEHQPIFHWIRLHFRRPGEACALYRSDFDGEIFTIHRAMSYNIVTESTKTGEIHVLPCHSEFRPWLNRMHRTTSPFFFVNHKARNRFQHYHVRYLERLWNKACRQVGEKIHLYAGMKHSSCSQFLNERGGSLSELQEITEHARAESVRRYAKTEVARKRILMEKKLIWRKFGERQ